MRARSVRHHHLPARTGAGGQLRHGRLPLRPPVPGVRSRHLPLRNGHDDLLLRQVASELSGNGCRFHNCVQPLGEAGAAAVAALRQKVAVLCRSGSWPGRALLSALARLLSSRLLSHLLVTPPTLPAWRRRALRHHRTHPRKPGQPRVDGEIQELVAPCGAGPEVRHRRILGAPPRLGHRLGASTIRRILTARRRGTAPHTADTNWRPIPHARAHRLLTSDFLPRRHIPQRCLSVLLLMGGGNPTHPPARPTTSPSHARVVHQARDLVISLDKRANQSRSRSATETARTAKRSTSLLSHSR